MITDLVVKAVSFRNGFNSSS